MMKKVFLIGSIVLLLIGLGIWTFNRPVITPDQLLQAVKEEPKYRHLLLKNKMKVLLVSDSSRDESAAALSVEIGSQNDQDYHLGLGLAHFLEHMLFINTQKFPIPDEFMKFLGEGNGYTNAYTALDHTNFFFRIEHPRFEEGLDRFAQFFISPLFDEGYSAKEVQAVESEFRKNIQNDGARLEQLRKLFMKPGHPYSFFTTGNIETLKGVGKKELKNFFEQTYSSNLMNLVLVSNKNLDELQKMAIQFFEPVVNKNLSAKKVSAEVFSLENHLRLIRMEPLSGQQALIMEFPLPSQKIYTHEKPLWMIGALLGHEGEGSLLSLLKKKNLVTALSAGPGDDTANSSSFDITVELTSDGLEKYQEVMSLIISYLEKLKQEGIPRYYFDEEKIMSYLNYEYRPKEEISQLAMSLARDMQMYPLDELPAIAATLNTYGADAYKKILEKMIPENMLTYLVAKDILNNTPADKIKKEERYGTTYSLEEIGEPFFSNLKKIKVHPELHYPKKNEFISSHNQLLFPQGTLELSSLSLIQLNQDELMQPLLSTLAPYNGQTFFGLKSFISRMQPVLAQKEVSSWISLYRSLQVVPQVIWDDELGKVWYGADFFYRRPKGIINLRFLTPQIYLDAHSWVLANMYEDVLRESLNEMAYPIQLAGLGFNVNVTRRGVGLTVSGYSSKLLHLCELVAKKLKNTSINEETFSSLKEKRLRELKNLDFLQPEYAMARYYAKLQTQEDLYPKELLIQELEKVTLQEVSNFSQNLYNEMFVEGSVVGNLDPKKVTSALKTIFKTVGFRPLPLEKHPQIDIPDLMKNTISIYAGKKNNSVALTIRNLGDYETKKEALLYLLDLKRSALFFSKMRTEEQLGYVARAGFKPYFNKIVMDAIIQSDKYSADYIRRRIDAFDPMLLEEFKKMTLEQFEMLKNSARESYSHSLESLADFSAYVDYSAFERKENFNLKEEVVYHIGKITLPDMLEFLEKTLPTIKRLTVEVQGLEAKKN